MKLKRRYRKAVIDLLSVAVLAISVLGIYIALQIFLNTSRPLVAVATGSMSPNYEVGDLLIVQGIQPNDIEEGDVIVFEELRTNELIVHRVIKVERSEDGGISFRTKGDANPIEDMRSVNSSLVHGRVACQIPYLGYIALVPTIPLIVIIVIAVIVLLF